MDWLNFSGKNITISCTGFYNPIYRDVWQGFSVSTFDGEIDYNEINIFAPIERSVNIRLDTTGYSPAPITGDMFMIYPQDVTVGTPSVWEFILEMPLPMEIGCFIRVSFPKEVTVDLSNVRGEGTFSTTEDDEFLKSEDYNV